MNAQAIALLFALVALAPAVALALHLDLARASSTYTPRHRKSSGPARGVNPLSSRAGQEILLSWDPSSGSLHGGPR